MATQLEKELVAKSAGQLMNASGILHRPAPTKAEQNAAWDIIKGVIKQLQTAAKLKSK